MLCNVLKRILSMGACGQGVIIILKLITGILLVTKSGHI